MKTTLIAVGDEVLCGDIINTNISWLAHEITALQGSVKAHFTVSDDKKQITDTVAHCLAISDLIITTGGLGPTDDDLTKNVIAEMMHAPLERSIEVERKIKEYFQSANREYQFTSNNLKQADIPKGAIVLDNQMGTAPGILLEKNGKIIILLPGPPREMKYLFDTHIRPYLTAKLHANVVNQYYMTTGMGESQLEQLLRDQLPVNPNITVNTYCNISGVTIKTVATGSSLNEAAKLSEQYRNYINRLIGTYIYSEDHQPLLNVVCNLLLDKKFTISCAESCTGGLLSSMLCSQPGISAAFKGSVVSYSNEIKHKLLSVSDKTLDTYGAVSSATAEEMVKGIQNVMKTDIAVSITGIAGPDGGTEEKPVGLVYIGIAAFDNTSTYRFLFSGDRSKIQQKTAYTALNLIRKSIHAIDD